MHKMCMSCEGSISAEREKDDKVIRITRDGTTIGIICEVCQPEVKTFRMAFTRATENDKFQPILFQCLDTFLEDKRKDYYENLDILSAPK